MAQRYRAQFRRSEGQATVTSRRGQRLWLEPKLSDAQWAALASDLSREIRDAYAARQPIIGDGQLLDYCDWLYEQGKSPQDHTKPWGADLNSYLVTESVDSLFARLVVPTFKAEPIVAVGGWGEDAKRKAPLAEEFLDFTFKNQEEEAQLMTALAHFQALLEDAGILEVTEGYEVQAGPVQEIDIAPETDETGGLLLGEDNLPKPKFDPDSGEPVMQQDPNGYAIRAKYRSLKPKLTGPQYDVISTRDFLFLPGHAKNKRELWGYAKRFWRRVPDLREKALSEIYREDMVAKLGTSDDRQATAAMQSRGQGVVPQADETAEKELWEVYFKRDLDGDGYAEWYIATVSVKEDVMLRCIIDDFGRARWIPWVPFPRRNSIYGYNFTAVKIASIAEEHAALRNMATDRSALATNPPLKQLDGGLWDADAEPVGTGSVIRVRSADEVTPLQIQDVPPSNVDLRQECLAAKERVTGVGDVAVTGVSHTAMATATRDTLQAQASAIRIDAAEGFLRESWQSLWELRRLIWIRKLESEQGHGMEMAGLGDRLALRGVGDFSGTITADDLEGRFYYKPSGSSATADPNRRRMESGQALIGLANLAKISPLIGQVLSSPEAAMAIMQTWARDNDVQDKQAFVNGLKKVIQAMAEQAANPALPMGGGPGGSMGGPMLPGEQPGGVPPMPPALMAMLNGGGSPGIGGGA